MAILKLGNSDSEFTGSFKGGTLSATSITASADISGSGLLFISSSESSDTSYKTVVRDPVTGRLYTTGSFGGGGSGVSLTVEEQDGSPTVSNVNKIKFSNGTVTDDGSGIVSIQNAGTFPFIGDAGITGSLSITGSAGSPAATHLTVFGSSSFSSTATFDKLVAERTILNGQVSIGNSTGDSIDFTSRVTSDFIASGNNDETLGTNTKPWFGATITNISASRISTNNTSSLRESNAGNLLYVGNDAKWQGIEYGRDTGQPSKFNGAIHATSDITASGDISSSADVYLTLSQFGSPSSALNTLVIDPEDGKVYATGSYGSGGGSSPATGLSDATKIFVWYQGMT